jgi:hypothetical protein
MANQPENPVWEAGIYQFETTDPVEGGLGGIDNQPLLQLANRTAYLKEHLDDAEADIVQLGLDITQVQTNLTNFITLASRFLPKKRGALIGLDPGESSGTKAVTGDMVSCVVVSNEPGTEFNSTTYLVTMSAGLANTNYKIMMSLEYTESTASVENDCFAPVFKILSQTQFRVSLQAQAAGTQGMKMHIDVISLD